MEPPTNGNRNADVVDEIGAYICAGLGMTLGTNFFVGELPEPGLDGVPQSNVDSVFLVEMPGPAPDMYIDTETHLFQAWASSASTVTAKTLMRQIYDILERKGNYTLVNWYIFFSYASGTIKDEGRGREGNKLCSQQWTLICRNLNNIS